MTLYDQLKNAGIPVESHESDLYALKTAESLRLVKESGQTFRTFISPLDETVWLDVPFAYAPYWAKKMSQT